MLSAGKTAAIKYHPRERRPGYLGLEEDERLYVIPPMVVFELLVLLLGEPAPLIVGDLSSALVSTRWLRPDVPVVAISHEQESADPGRGLERSFRALGIPMETDPRAVVGKHLGQLRT